MYFYVERGLFGSYSFFNTTDGRLQIFDLPNERIIRQKSLGYSHKVHGTVMLYCNIRYI